MHMRNSINMPKYAIKNVHEIIYAQICSKKNSQICQNMQWKICIKPASIAGICSAEYAIMCKYMLFINMQLHAKPYVVICII